jgi:hypothetical protein
VSDAGFIKKNAGSYPYFHLIELHITPKNAVIEAVLQVFICHNFLITDLEMDLQLLFKINNTLSSTYEPE